MNYKLLALDLDGTLTDSRKEVTPRTLVALLEAQQRGMRIVIASGRPPHGVAPVADLLQLDAYGGFALSFNGGEIRNWETREIVYRKTIDPAYLPYLYACAKSRRLAIGTFHHAFSITETPHDKYIRREAKISNLTVKEVSDFLSAIDFPVIKCMITGEPNELALLEKEMQGHLQSKLNVFRSEPYFLEIVAESVDKAKSLDILLNHLSLRRDELIAIGDGYNDASMIQFAGLGIAMANAQEEVRKQADRITLSNDEEGVAAIVEQLLDGTL
ncbi:Cof-type HAD-IIB family hydrolase [Phocaeicola abscessus]|uniref:Cof-type HAD-IIB family hydrolase n=1 Tax=Phocaeicola abscessus TaxID=555313 RepID=UPI0028F0BB56|nr:Cof-type HAD-IIB family hydrolase [Phocaeicola abscessus]